MKKQERVKWYSIENSTEIEYRTEVSNLLEKAYSIGAVSAVISSGSHLDLFKTQQLGKGIPTKSSPVIRKVVDVSGEKSNKLESREDRIETFLAGSDVVKNIDNTELTKKIPEFLIIPPLIMNWYYRTIDIFNDLSYLN